MERRPTRSGADLLVARHFRLLAEVVLLTLSARRLRLASGLAVLDEGVRAARKSLS
jgi:hypothetical protein